MQYNYSEYPLTRVGGYFCTLKLEREDNIMSNFTRFMKQNKKIRVHEKYAPTRSLIDEKSNVFYSRFYASDYMMKVGVFK